MLTTLVIVLLALALFAYVALPLILPGGADPLPSERDPVVADLEEEKAALFRAIEELELREDLPQERRDTLRARYEAKAAKVLRALDERSADGRERPAPRPARRAPYGALTLLALAVVIATSLGAFVLPRVGDGTVTTFFEEDLEGARQLRDLQQAVDRNPDADSLLALADGYWQLGDAEGAADTYLRAVTEADARSPLAYRRLGFLSLQTDLEAALNYLERARELDPNDLDTLYTLGEIYFVQGDLTAAQDAWQAFLNAPGGEGDEQVTARLALAERLQPLTQRLAEDPSRENLLAYGDALWEADERERAVAAYFQVLTEHDPNDPRALGRTGQLLFLSGRNEDAIALMERAAQSDRVDAQTLLFLGNAYFSDERYDDAISVWERYLAGVDESAAGRVPALIEDARARAAGGAPEDGAAGADDVAGQREAQGGDQGGAQGGTAEAGAQPGGGQEVAGTEDTRTSDLGGEPTLEAGRTVYAQNCANCHGPDGMGGAGPRLAGNSRARNEQNVRSAVTFGRGMMPGFSAALSPQEIEAVVEYVTAELGAAAGAR